MNRKVLQILSYAKLLEVEESDKLNLVAFIEEEATEAELKAFIMDGEIPYEIDAVTEQVIHDRFMNFSNVMEVNILKVGAVIAAIAAARRLVKQKVQKAEYACEDKSGMAKKLCMAKVKNKVYQEQLSRLNSMEGQCSQTQNPEQCRRIVNAAKERVKDKIEQNKATFTRQDVAGYGT
jgi:hypothetical protein